MESPLKVHLAVVAETELLDLLIARALHTRAGHTLIDEPQTADLILLLGNFGRDPDRLLHHPLFERFPDKCAVYTDDDIYLPLAPGVYASAVPDASSRAGRLYNYAHVSRNGRYSNPYIENRPESLKRLLFSFQGGSTSLLRKRLFNLRFNRSDVLIDNTSRYYHWDDSQKDRQDMQRDYAENISQSHFVLCPRGAGSSSIRLFEVMKAGVAPVLIADSYLLPAGIEWDSFLLRVPESGIARLPELVEPHLASSGERGAMARQAYLKHFAPEVEFDKIISLAIAALHHGPPSESYFRHLRAFAIAQFRLRERSRNLIRSAVLQAIKTLGLKNPYQMNRDT